jgi:hypothetical protein
LLALLRNRFSDDAVVGCPCSKTNLVDELPALQITDVDDHVAQLEIVRNPVSTDSRNSRKLGTHAEACSEMPDLQ